MFAFSFFGLLGFWFFGLLGFHFVGKQNRTFLVQQKHICMFTVKLTVDTHTHTYIQTLV